MGSGGQYLENVNIGIKVTISLKENRSKLIEGIVEEILTRSSFHEHGIMVRLDSGEIGRIKNLNDSTIEGNLKSGLPSPEGVAPKIKESKPQIPKDLLVNEGQIGINYKDLFFEYLKNAKKITITDTYIKFYYQARNLMDFLLVCCEAKNPGETLEVHLYTIKDDIPEARQEEYLLKMQKTMKEAGVIFTWTYDETLHARHIVTDTGYKILLDRGLDIFQSFDERDTFDVKVKAQEYRPCKRFEITYLYENKIL